MSDPLKGGILLLADPVNGEDYYRNELAEEDARLMEAIYLALSMHRDTRVINREDDLLENVAKAYLEGELTGDFLTDCFKNFCKLEQIEEDTKDYKFDFTGTKRHEFPNGGMMWAIGEHTWDLEEKEFRAAVCGQWAYRIRDKSPENRLLASLLAELDKDRMLNAESVGKLIAEYQASLLATDREQSAAMRKPAGSVVETEKLAKAAGGVQ